MQHLARAGRSLLLVLEDLHWCDDTSLEWLLHLACELKSLPLLVLLTYRSDEIHTTLTHMLATLDRMSYVHEVGLSRLTRADVEAMLRAILWLPGERTNVFREVRGNMSWARRGIALSEAKNDMRAIVLGYPYLSENSEYRGHWRDTQTFAARGHLFAHQSGWHNMEVWIELERLVVAYYQGDLVAARQLARDCVASATELDERRAVLYTNKLLILIETALGHEEAACRIGEQAVRDVDDIVGVGIRCWIRLALAGLYMQRKEYPPAVALYEQCADMLAGTENRVLQMELGAPLAESYGAHGRMAEASQVIVETLELTRASGARHYAEFFQYDTS